MCHMGNASRADGLVWFFSNTYVAPFTVNDLIKRLYVSSQEYTVDISSFSYLLSIAGNRSFCFIIHKTWIILSAKSIKTANTPYWAFGTPSYPKLCHSVMGNSMLTFFKELGHRMAESQRDRREVSYLFQIICLTILRCSTFIIIFAANWLLFRINMYLIFEWT